jgi:hypothetical protein
MINIKLMIEKCIEVDVENGIMTGDTAMEYYLNLPADRIIQIYEQYYGKEK